MSGNTDKGKEDDPITVFLQSLLSFFKQLLSPDLSDAPNEGGPNPGEAGAQGNFKKSAVDYFKHPANLAHIEGTWLDLQRTLDPKYATDPDHKRLIQAISPVEADSIVTSGFGHREIAVGSKDHKGYDIASSDVHNPNVVAAMPGVVVAAGARAGYGNAVEIIDIYGEHQIYGHLQSFSVKRGDRILQGQEIAVMGNTGHVDKEHGDGTHLHYEVRDVNGIAKPPEIMGHALVKGDHISLAKSNTFLAKQSQGQNNTEVAQNQPSAHPLSHIDISGINTPSSSYVPPVAAGGQPKDKSTSVGI
jgi:murein DD-endopeptidase MepM/ murein hydrolase activator NlpD